MKKGCSIWGKVRRAKTVIRNLYIKCLTCLLVASCSRPRALLARLVDLFNFHSKAAKVWWFARHYTFTDSTVGVCTLMPCSWYGR